MSRHSKWAKIKRAKMATDVKRGQLFSKLTRAITVAARERGPDPEANPQLRMAMDRALAENMPKDNVLRALERAAGSESESLAQALTLEAYGPGGTGVMIEAISDNRNRTVAEIRRILANHGGSLGESGSVAWQFERGGLIAVEEVTDPDAVALAAIEAGASDIDRDGRSLEISAAPEVMKAVAAAVEKTGSKPTSAELMLLPKQWLILDAGAMGKLQVLLEELTEHDDVVNVTTNAQPPET